MFLFTRTVTHMCLPNPYSPPLLSRHTEDLKKSFKCLLSKSETRGQHHTLAQQTKTVSPGKQISFLIFLLPVTYLCIFQGWELNRECYTSYKGAPPLSKTPKSYRLLLKTQKLILFLQI